MRWNEWKQKKRVFFLKMASEVRDEKCNRAISLGIFAWHGKESSKIDVGLSCSMLYVWNFQLMLWIQPTWRSFKLPFDARIALQVPTRNLQLNFDLLKNKFCNINQHVWNVHHYPLNHAHAKDKKIRTIIIKRQWRWLNMKL